MRRAAGDLGSFPSEVRAQARALACSLVQGAGVPLSRWSCAEVARRLVGLKAMACRTVGRWLQAERIHPWRYHLWQHPTDPHLMERAKPVLRRYEQARALLPQGV